MTRWIVMAAAGLGLGGAAALANLAPGRGTDDMAGDPIRRGRYLVQIGGCNDCHTPGYMASTGNVAEDKWLIGDSLGFNGPWGTTYPSNLRRFFRMLSEDDWVQFARQSETRPPMPWFNLRAMTEPDLRAIHRYVLSLPPDDNSVPDFVPPGVAPRTPYVIMVPQPPS